MSQAIINKLYEIWTRLGDGNQKTQLTGSNVELHGDTTLVEIAAGATRTISLSDVMYPKLSIGARGTGGHDLSIGVMGYTGATGNAGTPFELKTLSLLTGSVYMNSWDKMSLAQKMDIVAKNPDVSVRSFMIKVVGRYA